MVHGTAAFSSAKSRHPDLEFPPRQTAIAARREHERFFAEQRRTKNVVT